MWPTRNFKAPKTISVMALAAMIAAPTLTLADEVILKSDDGTVNLVGEFVEFSNGNYVIRTGLGDLRISASRVKCEGDACPDLNATQADVLVSGSDTIGLGAMPLLLSGYAASLGADFNSAETDVDGEVLIEMTGDDGFGDPLESFLINATTSTDGLRKLLENRTEISMASRRIRPDEARDLRDDGAGNMIDPDQEHVVGIDMLVTIVHPNNPVDELTTAQLQGIYAGEIANWSELGGADAPITVLSRPGGSGTRSVFEQRLFGDEVPALNAAFEIAETNDDMAEMVNSDANAIGFVGFAFQQGAKAIPLVNECGITLRPEPFAARTEEYGMQRLLYLYSRGDTLSEAGANFLDFATSSAADEVIAKAGFIDLGVARQAQGAGTGRTAQVSGQGTNDFETGVVQDMLADMATYDRLSTIFRFRTGSSDFSERNIALMNRLGGFLATQPAGTEIRFVGFTDDVGAFESNRDLSVGRAAQVEQVFRDTIGQDLSGITTSVAGYGEIAPLACNTDEDGRSVNRRVEVWIKSPAG